MKQKQKEIVESKEYKETRKREQAKMRPIPPVECFIERDPLARSVPIFPYQQARIPGTTPLHEVKHEILQCMTNSCKDRASKQLLNKHTAIELLIPVENPASDNPKKRKLLHVKEDDITIAQLADWIQYKRIGLHGYSNTPTPLTIWYRKKQFESDRLEEVRQCAIDAIKAPKSEPQTTLTNMTVRKAPTALPTPPVATVEPIVKTKPKSVTEGRHDNDGSAPASSAESGNVLGRDMMLKSRAFSHLTHAKDQWEYVWNELKAFPIPGNFRMLAESFEKYRFDELEPAVTASLTGSLQGGSRVTFIDLVMIASHAKITRLSMRVGDSYLLKSSASAESNGDLGSTQHAVGKSSGMESRVLKSTSSDGPKQLQSDAQELTENLSGTTALSLASGVKIETTSAEQSSVEPSGTSSEARVSDSSNGLNRNHLNHASIKQLTEGAPADSVSVLHESESDLNPSEMISGTVSVESKQSQGTGQLREETQDMEVPLTENKMDVEPSDVAITSHKNNMNLEPLETTASAYGSSIAPEPSDRVANASVSNVDIEHPEVTVSSFKCNIGLEPSQMKTSETGKNVDLKSSGAVVPSTDSNVNPRQSDEVALSNEINVEPDPSEAMALATEINHGNEALEAVTSSTERSTDPPAVASDGGGMDIEPSETAVGQTEESKGLEPLETIPKIPESDKLDEQKRDDATTHHVTEDRSKTISSPKGTIDLKLAEAAVSLSTKCKMELDPPEPAISSLDLISENSGSSIFKPPAIPQSQEATGKSKSGQTAFIDITEDDKEDRGKIDDEANVPKIDASIDLTHAD
jgi:hypothetical protein